MTKRWMRIGLLALVGACLYGTPLSALEPGPKCEVNKLKTAGVYSLCRLKAEARAVKKGEAPDYSKCDDNFGKKWGKIESKADGACPVTGDQLQVQSKLTGDTDSLGTSIAGEPECGNGILDPGEACDVGGFCTATWCFEGQSRLMGGTCGPNCYTCGICRSVLSGSSGDCRNCPAGILDCPSAGGFQECLAAGGCQSSDDCPAGMTCQFFPASEIYANCCTGSQGCIF